MRRFFLIAALVVFAAAPLAAQNTDIEALSGLQFNFGNPGARSLGMGGAFVGRADDASAAEANPAGLTILRKPEISLEARNYMEQQTFTTSGTFPNIERTPFTHYSDRVVVTFASAVYPIRNKFTVGLYYHEPLQNAGGGAVFPQIEPTPRKIVKKTPNFFLPAAGGDPMTEAACVALRQQTKNPGACLEYRVDPFISALDVRERTFGLAGAWQVLPTLSIGATARFQMFKEGAFTSRYDGITFDLKNISVQATARANGNDVKLTQEHDITFGVGLKWAPSDKISFGAVYKQGPQFSAPTFFLGSQTQGQFVKVADTKFHLPDIAGAGVSYQPIPVLTVNADVDYVRYSNLVDNFVSVVANVSDLSKPFAAKNATEFHIGAEYFFAVKVPFAIRAGYWRDPAHAVTWNGPTTKPDYIAEAMLYPKTSSQKHYSIGGGFAWPRFQIDFAYDTAETYKVGSISMVTRF
ncbi:MAG TPA: outer membrane protein transport protein [Thermoanaerobaculia bacterium]|nr:outer membrane protein transport protein [Thermoanaerobaculia bacterium]